MADIDLIKKKAKKLKALADKGISGEKDNAKVFLNEFMKKHNLTEKDVDDDGYIRLFKQNGLDYNTIVTHSIMSINPYCNIIEENKSYKVSLDDSDFTEVEYKTSFFYELLLKEMNELFDIFKRDDLSFKKKSDDFQKELFFTAFMTKHGRHFQPDREAFLKHQPKIKPMSKKEAEAMQKAQKEAEKAFRENQKKEAENKKDKNNDKSIEPPTPIDYSDMDRIYRIIEYMREANYVKVRNVLPVYTKKIKNGTKRTK